MPKAPSTTVMTLASNNRVRSLDRWNLAYLMRRDHLGDPGTSIDTSVRSLVREKTGIEPAGPIRLLTHLRYFGHCFNPVSLFYCLDAANSCVETVVAEVNNTPWYERYCYVLTEGLNDTAEPWKHYRFKKSFHVSPFIGMLLRRCIPGTLHRRRPHDLLQTFIPASSDSW